MEVGKCYQLCLSAGDLVAFIVYALNISRSVGQASRLYTAVNTAAGASERLFELQQEKIEQDNKFNKKTATAEKLLKEGWSLINFVLVMRMVSKF